MALEKNLEQSKLNILALQAGLSGAGNFRNFSDQMTYASANRTFVQSPLMALTNPFAWANFIKSIKNGDLKRDDYKKVFRIKNNHFGSLLLQVSWRGPGRSNV